MSNYDPIIAQPTWRGTSGINVIRRLGLNNSLQVCLDAGDDLSYSSGQVWFDTSGNGYDFNRGATSGAESSDPTFNGTAGRRTDGEYWSFDGGDFFTYDTTTEAWMQTLHQNNALFTLAGWWYLPSASFHLLVTTLGGGTAASSDGISFQTTATRELTLFVGSAATADTTLTSTIQFANSAWTFIAVSLDEAAGASGSLWQINEAQETFNGTYSAPSAVAADGAFQLGARGSSFPLASGSRLGMMNIWTRALSAAELTTLFHATRNRYGV